MLEARVAATMQRITAERLKVLTKRGRAPAGPFRCLWCPVEVRAAALGDEHKVAPYFARCGPHAPDCGPSDPERAEGSRTPSDDPVRVTLRASDLPTVLDVSGDDPVQVEPGDDEPGPDRHRGTDPTSSRAERTTNRRAVTVRDVATRYLPSRSEAPSRLRVREVAGRTYGECFKLFDPAVAGLREYRIWFAPLRWNRAQTFSPVGAVQRLDVQVDEAGRPRGRLGHVLVDRTKWTERDTRDFDNAVAGARAAAKAAHLARKKAGGRALGAPVTAWVCVLGAPGPTVDTITVTNPRAVCCFAA